MKNGNNTSPRVKMLLAAALILAVIAATVAGVAAVKKGRAAKAAHQLGGSFSADGFDGVTDAVCLNEELAVFTDKGGKKGIMRLDGTVTEKAEQDAVYTVSDEWRVIKYVCKGPLSEYALLIDADTGTVTTRQYHGPNEPEKAVYWSVTGNHLAYYDSLGYAGEVFRSDLNPDEGLYPVQACEEDGGKWGYINENLSLEISLFYEKALDFSGSLAPVMRNGKWGYINKQGVTAIDFQYEPIGPDGAFTFRNGLAPVKKDGLCGIINTKGKEVVSFAFEDILQGENGKYIAKKDGLWGLLTVNEEIISAESTASTTAKKEDAAMQGNYKVVTSGSYLNLRATADINSAVLEHIPNGTVLTVTKSVDGWAYTTYNSASGWVSTDYIREIETQSAARTQISETQGGGANA